MSEHEGYATELKKFPLDAAREKELLDKQSECVFMWTNKQGEPVGVVMCYVAAGGKIWLALTESRARVSAVKREPRTCICVSSIGTDMKEGKTVTYKGNTRVHSYDSPEIRDWFFEALAKRLYPGDSRERINEIAGHLRIPERVVFEFTPIQKIAYDRDKNSFSTGLRKK